MLNSPWLLNHLTKRKHNNYKQNWTKNRSLRCTIGNSDRARLMLIMLMSYCLSNSSLNLKILNLERYEDTERQRQWYWQKDNISVLNASMNIFHDGKNCPESFFPSILCVLILGKSLHKPHWPLKWSRRKAAGWKDTWPSGLTGSIWLHLLLYAKKQPISAESNRQANMTQMYCFAWDWEKENPLGSQRSRGFQLAD